MSGRHCEWRDFVAWPQRSRASGEVGRWCLALFLDVWRGVVPHARAVRFATTFTTEAIVDEFYALLGTGPAGSFRSSVEAERALNHWFRRNRRHVRNVRRQGLA